MLTELIQGLSVKQTKGSLRSFSGTQISGISQDSRKVQKGFLFVAIEGGEIDGHQFVSDAVKRGASAVVVSKPVGATTVPQIIVTDSRKTLADLSARFYGDPSAKMTVIGITGTNGKTTLTYLIESILKAAGRRPAVLGTINRRFENDIFPSEHTTPESLDLQEFFSQMLKRGATDVVMEVSSHALALQRVQGIHFDVGVFTNLTQDHLDFHQNLEDYFQSKLKLFTNSLPQSHKKQKFAVINMEDPRADSMIKQISVMPVRSGLTGPYEVACLSYQLSEEGIRAKVKSGSHTLEIYSPLLGKFNLENILSAMGVALSLRLPPESIVEGIKNMTLVPGRLERIENRRGLSIFVDYAHTPGALARVGQELKKIARGRVLTVFGCGGNRDRGKRPMMGHEAGLFSDLVIVTSDNPRTEDPASIIDEILPGLEEVNYPEERIYRIVDRAEALQKALDLARRGDLILVAGKGHEDYQIVGKKKFHFSDQEILKKILCD